MSQANDLLSMSYQVYQYTGMTKTILRTPGYSLPAALHKHVRTVVPTMYFSPLHISQQTLHKCSMKDVNVNAMREGPVTAFSSRDDDLEVVLAVLRGLYNTVAYVPTAIDKNVLTVAGYMGNSLAQLTWQCSWINIAPTCTSGISKKVFNGFSV